MAYAAHPYTLMQTLRPVGRGQELGLLTDWVVKPDSRVYQNPMLSFIAIGAMGKSAFTWHFFEHIAPQEMRGDAAHGRLWLSFLARIEALACEKFGVTRLSEYFDFTAGTSTGAIIAAGLAKRDSVEDLQRLYRQLATSIFKKRFWRRGLLIPKFKENPLADALEEHFGVVTFADPEIKTGLMIMTKRWDTGSPWVVHNSRNGPYWKYTKDYVLKEVIRASTAAPSYFKPEIVVVKQGQLGAFVDGGVTRHNNPALQLLLLTQLAGHGLQYPLGAASCCWCR